MVQNLICGVVFYLVYQADKISSWKKCIRSQSMFLQDLEDFVNQRRQSLHEDLQTILDKQQQSNWHQSIRQLIKERCDPKVWEAHKNLELVRIRNMEVIVRKSKSKKTRIPSWMGGRMSFSAHLSDLLKNALFENRNQDTPEFQSLAPVFNQQKKESIVPQPHQFLIERFETKEGFHTVFYPFEGYAIHEALASLVAYRISLLSPITFSMSFNDYGFELLSDQTFSKEVFLDNNLLTINHLHEDLEKSINVSEMARRRFRDIAVISGLVFQGFHNKPIKAKHLQSSSKLFFDVFKDYEPNNLLYQQALEETFDHGMERGRMTQVFENIQRQNIIWRDCSQPTPFSFPLITDRIRSKLSSESVEDRIKKMHLQLLKGGQ